MDYFLLGKSELRISQLGFGCCPMGGHGWGKVEPEKVTKAVSVALDNGVNFFDTADVYGLGESERILGKSLKERRNEAIIATKFGVRKDNKGCTVYDNSPKWINFALNESLKRLKTDHVDLYQLHYRDGKTPLSDVFEVLEQKKAEGKIRYTGLSNITAKELEQYKLPKILISFQAEYSLSNRLNEQEIIKLAKERELGFLSWGSLGQGVLSGKYGIDTKFPENDRRSRLAYVNFRGERFKNNMRIVNKMKSISRLTGKTLPQIAIRWIIDYLGFGSVLVGVKEPEQILQNIKAFGWHLDQNDLHSLESISIHTT